MPEEGVTVSLATKNLHRSDPPSPLHVPHEVLEHTLGWLPVSDRLNSSTVSQLWRSAALQGEEEEFSKHLRSYRKMNGLRHYTTSEANFSLHVAIVFTSWSTLFIVATLLVLIQAPVTRGYIYILFVGVPLLMISIAAFAAICRIIIHICPQSMNHRIGSHETFTSPPPDSRRSNLLSLLHFNDNRQESFAYPIGNQQGPSETSEMRGGSLGGQILAIFLFFFMILMNAAAFGSLLYGADLLHIYHDDNHRTAEGIAEVDLLVDGNSSCDRKDLSTAPTIIRISNHSRWRRCMTIQNWRGDDDDDCPWRVYYECHGWGCGGTLSQTKFYLDGDGIIGTSDSGCPVYILGSSDFLDDLMFSQMMSGQRLYCGTKSFFHRGSRLKLSEQEEAVRGEFPDRPLCSSLLPNFATEAFARGSMIFAAASFLIDLVASLLVWRMCHKVHQDDDRLRQSAKILLGTLVKLQLTC